MEHAKHLLRAAILLVLTAAGFLYFRTAMVPESFGTFGYYRADALEEHRSRELVYRTTELCNNCHPEIMKMRKEGRHFTIHCEDCHGPGSRHTDWKGEVVIGAMTINRSRENCLTCHRRLTARPADFPQIDELEHLEAVGVEREDTETLCVKCHNPHHPTRDDTLCGNCHPGKVALKSNGGHRVVVCRTCHYPIKRHRLVSGMEKLPKPVSRENCARCHDVESEGPDASRLKIDVVGHLVAGGVEPTDRNRLCVHCHNPHRPMEESKLCGSCHVEQARTRTRGVHRALACGECHAPFRGHVRFKDERKPRVDRSQKTCTRCHGAGTRPFVRGIKQIDVAGHLAEAELEPDTACVECHSPHDPL
jgi:hypothetical protein